MEPETVSGIDAPEIMNKYEDLISYDWDLTNEGMLKTVFWRAGDKTCILFAAHHLLTDGRGLLGLAEEFADIYVSGREPVPAEEKLITAGDLPADSKMPFMSRLLVNNANRNWAKERSSISYDQYHRYAMEYVKENKPKHYMERTDDASLSKLIDDCHANGVTVNDALIAQMMIEEKTDKVKIALDLRKELECYNPGALGNYSTAFGVVVKRRSDDVMTLARAVHKEVRRKESSPSDKYLILQCYANLDPGVLDAAFMAAKGGFTSKAASFIGTKFFGFKTAAGHSITNLGKISNDNIFEACFVPPASPAVLKTKGVLTVNNRMIVCTTEA